MNIMDIIKSNKSTPLDTKLVITHHLEKGFLSDIKGHQESIEFSELPSNQLTGTIVTAQYLENGKWLNVSENGQALTIITKSSDKYESLMMALLHVAKLFFPLLTQNNQQQNSSCSININVEHQLAYDFIDGLMQSTQNVVIPQELNKWFKTHPQLAYSCIMEYAKYIPFIGNLTNNISNFSYNDTLKKTTMENQNKTTEVNQNDTKSNNPIPFTPQSCPFTSDCEQQNNSALNTLNKLRDLNTEKQHIKAISNELLKNLEDLQNFLKTKNKSNLHINQLINLEKQLINIQNQIQQEYEQNIEILLEKDITNEK